MGTPGDHAASLFVDDDASYLEWLANQTDGFVLNASRKPSGSYLMLHAARCRTISGAPARGERWTGDYIKICAAQRAAVQRWVALLVPGGVMTDCQICLA